MDDADGYDYSLPEELIAQHGLEQRDQARLLVVRREVGVAFEEVLGVHGVAARLGRVAAGAPESPR